MSKEEVLGYFYTNSSEYGVKTTLLILLCGLAVGMVIYLTYFISSEKIAYNRKFNWSLVTMHLITVVVMLMISSNIAVSLGMVGALSIVRFRTAVKEPLDLAFLFWAIAVGIVLAAGMIPLAVFGSLITGLILLVFVNRKSHVTPYIVVLQCGDGEAEAQARALLEASTRRCAVKSKTVREGLVELNLDVRLRDGDTGFVNALAGLEGVRSAVLVSYNGDYLG